MKSILAIAAHAAAKPNILCLVAEDMSASPGCYGVQEVSTPNLDRFATEAFVPTAEDLIVQKLRWARDKDIADIRDMLGVQGDALDFAYVERWCRTHGTLVRFEEIRRSIPADL
ncbi:MAG: hypothetical protein ABMA13_01470 [Chthoniobacteraceae bacterium]